MSYLWLLSLFCCLNQVEMRFAGRGGDAIETVHAPSLQIQCDWTARRRCTQRLYKRNVIGRGRDGARPVSTNAM